MIGSWYNMFSESFVLKVIFERIGCVDFGEESIKEKYGYCF